MVVLRISSASAALLRSNAAACDVRPTAGDVHGIVPRISTLTHAPAIDPLLGTTVAHLHGVPLRITDAQTVRPRNIPAVDLIRHSSAPHDDRVVMRSAGQCRPIQMSAGDTPRQMCFGQDDETVAVSIAAAFRIAGCDIALVQCVRRMMCAVDGQCVAIDVAVVVRRADVARRTRIRIRPRPVTRGYDVMSCNICRSGILRKQHGS